MPEAAEGEFDLRSLDDAELISLMQAKARRLYGVND